MYHAYVLLDVSTYGKQACMRSSLFLGRTLFLAKTMTYSYEYGKSWHDMTISSIACVFGMSDKLVGRRKKKGAVVSSEEWGERLLGSMSYIAL